MATTSYGKGVPGQRPVAQPGTPNIAGAINSLFGGMTGTQQQSGGSYTSGTYNGPPRNPYEAELLKKNPHLQQRQQQQQRGGTQIPGGNYQVPPLPKLENTAQPDPKLEELWAKWKDNLDAPNAKMDDLWNRYQGQLDTSNLDRLQDVTGSKIRDRYEGARSGLQDNLARRGMLGSGVQQELGNELTMSELGDLSQSDATLALADQGRKDSLILSGMPLAGYDQQRLDQQLLAGLPIASTSHSLANQDRGLGLDQWSKMIDAQLGREQFGLQRDLAAQSAQMNQQQMMLSMLGSLMPLF